MADQTVEQIAAQEQAEQQAKEQAEKELQEQKQEQEQETEKNNSQDLEEIIKVREEKIKEKYEKIIQQLGNKEKSRNDFLKNNGNIEFFEDFYKINEKEIQKNSKIQDLKNKSPWAFKTKNSINDQLNGNKEPEFYNESIYKRIK